MIRAAALALMLTLPMSGAWAGVAEDAAAASVALQESVTALQEAEKSKDRVAALTATIRAYEQGLAALREAGGTFADLSGAAGPHGGSAVASNALLHSAVLDML